MPSYLAGFVTPSKVEIGWRKARAGVDTRCNASTHEPFPLLPPKSGVVEALSGVASDTPRLVRTAVLGIFVAAT